MKKLLAVLICAMLVSGSAAITASAYDSPTVKDSDTSSKPTGDSDEDTNKDKSSDSDNSSEGNSSTSPATGAPVSYAILMVAAAAAFGGVALATKKKIEEN